MERSLVLVALFAALIAVLGLIPPLTLISGVPISAQSLGIMLCGCILGSKRGALAVLLFLLLIAIGLPLLSGGRGGLGVFAGPTVGFLVGWVCAAFVTGLVCERWTAPRPEIPALVGSLLGGVVVLYAIGTVGMAVILEMGYVEALALNLPFIPGDLVKAVIAALLTGAVWRSRPHLLAYCDDA